MERREMSNKVRSFASLTQTEGSCARDGIGVAFAVAVPLNGVPKKERSGAGVVAARHSPIRYTVELRLGLQPRAEPLTLPNSSATIKTDAGEDDMVCPLVLLNPFLLVFTNHAGRTKNRSDKHNERAPD